MAVFGGTSMNPGGWSLFVFPTAGILTAPRCLDERKTHDEGCAREVGAILGNRGAAVKFGDQAHDVQPQAEMRSVVLALPVLEQRFEQPGQDGGRKRRSIIDDGVLVTGGRTRPADHDRPRG